jgi:hypothetical protein
VLTERLPYQTLIVEPVTQVRVGRSIAGCLTDPGLESKIAPNVAHGTEPRLWNAIGTL